MENPLVAYFNSPRKLGALCGSAVSVSGKKFTARDAEYAEVDAEKHPVPTGLS